MRGNDPGRLRQGLLSLLALALLALLAACSRPAASQDGPPLGWGARSAAPGYARQQGRAVAVDPSGNIYVAGYTVDETSRAGYAVVKYDPAGFQLWERRYHSPGSDGDYATALALSEDGSVSLTGYAAGGAPACDFTTVRYDADGVLLEARGYNTLCGPGESVSAVIVDAQGNTCVTGEFLDPTTGEYLGATLKFDAAGLLLWGQPFGAPADGRRSTTALATDPAGNVYVTGYGYDAQRSGAFLTEKYNAAGARLWSRRYEGPRWSEARALAVDQAGSVYVAGAAGAGIATVKYDADGSEVWAQRYEGQAGKDDGAEALAVNDAGEVYVAGWSEDASGRTDCVTLKYAADGTPLWEQAYQGRAGGDDQGASVALDAGGLCYVTGTSSNGIDFDFVTIAYDPSGFPLWSSRYSYFYGPAGTAPPAPCNLAAEALNSTAVRVSWTNTGSDRDTFQVERRAGDGEFGLVATLRSGISAFTDGGLVPATRYTYRVRTLGSPLSSRYSPLATVGTPPDVPIAPFNLTAQKLPDPAVLLSWDDVLDEEGYRIERSTPGTDFVPLASLDPDVNEYRDPDVEPDKEYVYRVQSFNASGTSAFAFVTVKAKREIPLLRVQSASEQEIALSWLPPETEDPPATYLVERSPDGFTFTPGPPEPIGGTSYTAAGLTQDTLYYFRVRGSQVDGPGPPSNAVAVYTLPAAIGDLAVTVVSQTALGLTWTDRYANEIDYRIERRAGTLPFEEVTTLDANTSTYLDEGLSPDTSYTYRVGVANPTGTSTSNLASETTLPLPPAAPTTLKSTVVSQTRIDLTWTRVGTSESGFEIQRRQGSDDWAPLGTTPAAVTRYSDLQLSAMRACSYRVRAVNRGGASAYSNVVSGTTLPDPPAPPELTAVSPSPLQIRLTWTDLPDETGYRVERQNSAGTFGEIAALAAGVTTFTDNGLKPLTSYVYRLRATNAGGSSYSPQLVAATQGCTITGRVTSSEGPVAGVEIRAGTLTVTTGADGTYALSGLPSATYTLNPVLPGFLFTPASLRIAVTSVTSGAGFTAARLYRITGTVTDRGLPVAGATIRAAGRVLSTGTDGTYSITDLVAGTYTVSIAKTGCVFSPTSMAVTLGPDRTGADFRVVTYTLTGRVNLAGAGLPGVRVSAGTRATLTGTDGAYTLAGLPPGSYTVRAVKTGYTFSPAQQALSLTADRGGVNFTALRPPGLRSPGAAPRKR